MNSNSANSINCMNKMRKVIMHSKFFPKTSESDIKDKNNINITENDCKQVIVNNDTDDYEYIKKSFPQKTKYDFDFNVFLTEQDQHDSNNLYLNHNNKSNNTQYTQSKLNNRTNSFSARTEITEMNRVKVDKHSNSSGNLTNVSNSNRNSNTMNTSNSNQNLNNLNGSKSQRDKQAFDVSEYQKKLSHYRESLKEKITTEDIFRKELIRISENSFTRKIEKNKIVEEHSNILSELKKLKLDYEVFIFHMEAERKKNYALKDERDNSFSFTAPSSPEKREGSTGRRKPLYIDSPNNIFPTKDLIKHKKFLDKKKDFDSKIGKLEDDLVIVNKKLRNIEIDISLYKVSLNTITRDQRTYYLDILGRGLDVR